MGIFDRIMSSIGSIFGRDEPSGDESTTRETRVSVERDTRTDSDDDGAENEEPVAAETDAAASTGSVVDEETTDEPEEAAEPSEAVDVADDGSEVTSDEVDEDADESVAADTEAAASTGSVVDDGTTDDPAEAAEPAEAAQPTDEADPITGEAAGADVVEEAEPENESYVDDDAGDGDVPDTEAANESVDNVKGIGPAYAERLADAGVSTVGELVAADPESLADDIGVSEKRIARWIDRAKERLDS
ncbi:Helix-hairpin-helix domain-containing protein [Halopelagius inordinatus]|uniref:Helix-hairpin-helix domain-containing protein n=1 Tax=Halopelagius inordinatus TaxID=553467 RepID=A0A1I2MQW9_9EURY|nr:helix-hairpin-helix domain-containing protein [Halopelagius inordinatus]SFF91521.1 Helix-hairpin-helix domain-containing protein [Halopelagius inordinatus]